ncbi:membrane-bound lytic murein transglycosylase B [Kribbella steppae]|uniref:Membrane-bound lytic murein transglycosylase B n=1 Tax=Kribbella steppae TaxID=2512223 RepID=A0A4V6NN69_9ACTN|nr:lytic transglycosylase domain-containing protein [Kribbella steppae]TCO33420.1 membrane-bound lytic murein transglycosylase B [Kribbella steppae]
MRVPGLHKFVKRHGRRHQGRHRAGRPAPRTAVRSGSTGSRWQLAGAVAAVVTLAALATAPLPDRPATGGYDAAGAADAPAVDPFIEDEALAEFVEPEQLVAVPVGPGRVAKPVQMVLSGGPVITALGESGIPDVALRAYKQAEARLAVSDPGCGVPWTLLAAIGRVESNHGQFGGAQLRDDGSATRRIRGIPLDGRPNVALIRDSDDGALDGDSEYDRAVGPMQFIPSTWRAVNADGNGDGFGDPNNMFDAAQGAAQYLCTGTSDLRDPGRAAQAVRRYNNADSYVRVVLALARMYQAGRVIGLPSTGDQLPNDPVDPPAARRWAADSPAAPPWTADPPTERPWTAAPPAARPWPTNPQPDDAVVAQPAPVQRTEPSAPPPRGVSRPRTTTPPPDQPTPAAPSPGKTAIREPAPTTPSEPPTVRPPQPRPTTNPTPAAPEPTQTRPSAPTRPSEPEPTTTPNPSEPATTRPPNPAPSGQGTTRPTEPVPSEARTTRPSEPGPSEPATKRPPAPKATESKPSESEPKPSEPSKSGSSTSAPSAEPTPAQEPTTAAVGWAPAMRQVVGRALARPACPPTPTPPPAQPSETCPDDSPEQSPARDDKDRHRCTPQNACKAAGSPR